MVADAMFPNAAETTEIEDIAVAPVTLVGALVGIPRRHPMLKLISSKWRWIITTRIDNCFISQLTWRYKTNFSIKTSSTQSSGLTVPKVIKLQRLNVFLVRKSPEKLDRHIIINQPRKEKAAFWWSHDGLYMHAYFEDFKNFAIYQVFGGQIHCHVCSLVTM